MRVRHVIFRGIRRYLRKLPDAIYLRLLYWGYTGRFLHLKKPKRFTEKIQWLKLYDRNSFYTTMVDKVAAKGWVTTKIGAEYIIPTLGVFDTWDEIDFKKLPDSFVIKTSHGGGSNGVVVVKNKVHLDKSSARRIIEKSLSDDGYSAYRGYQYKNVPKKILIEEYLEPESGEDMIDYKFFCFNGEPLYCQVIRDRNICETIDFYDMDWKLMPFIGLNPKVKNGNEKVERPGKLGEMINIAKSLSSGMPFLRVDLYNVRNQVFFGEVTFHPATGLGFFTPDEYDFILGDKLKLPEVIKK